MCAAVIGGMERLRRQYVEAARQRGVSLQVFNGKENNVARRMSGCDLALIFTNKVSHKARDEAIRFCKTNDIPYRLVHGCGVSTLTKCLDEN